MWSLLIIRDVISTIKYHWGFVSNNNNIYGTLSLLISTIGVLSLIIIVYVQTCDSVSWSITFPQDGDGKISLKDFKEGAKKDPIIIQSLSMFEGLV